MTNRTRLDEAALSRLPDTGLWTAIQVREEVGSTNAEVSRLAGRGAAEGLVITAESQSAGRGRAERDWSSPPKAGIAVSVLLRPHVSQARWSWLPLLAGVALADTITEVAGIDAALKWPNDLLLGEPPGKAAGILAEVVDGAVVLGIGLNVSLTRDELPRADATSLLLAGATTLDRTRLLAGLLTRLAHRYERWTAVAGDPIAAGLRRDYVAACHTLGQEVRVMLPDGSDFSGAAADIDVDGRLCVDTALGRTPVAAGDVHHVRLR